MYQNALEKQKISGDIWMKNALAILRDTYVVCLYFGVAVIKLLSLTSVSCYQILKNSKKLKHFEVPKKDALKVIH